MSHHDKAKGEIIMDNDKIRERMQIFVNGCRTSYIQIAKDMGLGEPSRYIISRFLKGIRLNNDTLQTIDKYLTAKGY